MAAAQKPGAKQAAAGARIEIVIGSAAGAIMRLADIELMLDAPDEQVGRLLKSEVRRLLEVVVGDRIAAPSHDTKVLVGTAHFLRV